MAVAAYTTDLTDLVADSATTANWAALGGGASGLNIETDYFIEGTRCVSKNAWAGSAKGMIEDTTASTLSTGSGKAVYTWMTHHTPGSLGTKAQGGLRVLLGSSASVYNEYYYAGSDTIDYGAPWICAVVDPDNATADSGTVTTANMNSYGGIANLPSGGPTKGAPFGIDEIRYGRTIEISGGDGADSDATFTGVAAANDSQTARWGQFQRTPGSTTNFTQQCRLEFGKTSATSSACTFTDSNKNITINDLEHVASGFIEYDVTQGSTVSLTGCNFTATAGGNTRGNWVTTSATSVDLTSCSFTNMGTFGFSSAYTVTGSTFRGCNKVTGGGATFTDCLFDNSTDTYSLSVSDIDDITTCTFNSDGSNHAVELTALADGDWDSTTTGYVTGSTGNGVQITGGSITGNETIYINQASGTVNISVAAGATVPSVATAGCIVNVTANQVTLTLTGIVADSAANISGGAESSEVRIYTSGTTTELAGIEDVVESTGGSKIGTFAYTYTYAPSTFVDIVVHHIDYNYYRINNYELGSGSASLPISQIPDRNYSNP